LIAFYSSTNNLRGTLHSFFKSFFFQTKTVLYDIVHTTKNQKLFQMSRNIKKRGTRILKICHVCNILIKIFIGLILNYNKKTQLIMKTSIA